MPVPNFNYPILNSATALVDYFGTVVSDPYQSLENLEAITTQTWLNAQEQFTTSFFINFASLQAKIKQQIESFWHYPKYSVFTKIGANYFFWGLDLAGEVKLQEQAVLYRQSELETSPIPILDPVTLDSSGKVAINYQAFSKDGSLVAYAASSDGGDWQEIKIRDTHTLADYKEVLKGCKAVSLAWKTDNSGFWYNRHVPVANSSQVTKNRLFWHTLGTPQAEDQEVLIEEQDEEKELSYYPLTSSDGRYLIIYACQGTEPHNRVYYQDLSGENRLIKLLNGNEAQYTFIGNVGANFYFQTTWQALNGQIIKIELDKPDREFWQTVVAEAPTTLNFTVLAGKHLVVGYLDNACHHLKVYNLAGTFETEIPLPAFSTVAGISGQPESPELFLSLENFTSPASVYCYNILTAQLVPLVVSVTKLVPENYTTRQVFYSSKDGTSVPLFLVHKKGLELNGKNRVLLTAYGGFGISMTPLFAASQVLWLAAGGVLAVAGVRGGGEYGVAWHTAGRGANKQNTFDDFCAAANWLITQGYTIPRYLAATGHSNAGLTVAASLVQVPDLFGAVVCRAGLTDMLRYSKFGAGQNWRSEYGEATASQSQFAVLHAYSPVHNVKKATYPATLITTTLDDERVHPMHALKFAAALQAHTSGHAPILLQIERQGGHGLGKATTQIISELSAIYTFLFVVLNLSL